MPDLYFCISVALQLHHQTTSWQQRLHAIVLSFIAAVFPTSLSASLGNDGDWNLTNPAGVGADGCWIAVVVFPEVYVRGDESVDKGGLPVWLPGGWREKVLKVLSFKMNLIEDAPAFLPSCCSEQQRNRWNKINHWVILKLEDQMSLDLLWTFGLLLLRGELPVYRRHGPVGRRFTKRLNCYLHLPSPAFFLPPFLPSFLHSLIGCTIIFQPGWSTKSVFSSLVCTSCCSNEKLDDKNWLDLVLWLKQTCLVSFF